MSDNPQAFPGGTPARFDGAIAGGMTLRDWFAGQALANPQICTGTAPDYDLTRWFGKYATGVRKCQIVAKQAGDYADAMLAARSENPNG